MGDVNNSYMASMLKVSRKSGSKKIRNLHHGDQSFQFFPIPQKFHQFRGFHLDYQRTRGRSNCVNCVSNVNLYGSVDHLSDQPTLSGHVWTRTTKINDRNLVAEVD